MNAQWDFVIAAYALTALLTAAAVTMSWRAMRRAETQAEALMRDRT